MLLAVDFDGVIHDKANPIKGRRMGAPIEGAKEALVHFKTRGDEVVIFTVMAITPGGTKAVADWMDYYEIPCDSITSTKPNADMFIDDKAIRFNDWEQTLSDMWRLYEVV